MVQMSVIEKYCPVLYHEGVIPSRLCSASLIAVLMLCVTCEPRSASGPGALARPQAPETNLVNSSEDGENAVTAEFLRAQIQKLSSDELEGRGPGTRGDQAARAYLEAQLQALGLSALPGLA